MAEENNNSSSANQTPSCFGSERREDHDLEYLGREVHRNTLYEVFRCRRTGCYRRFRDKVGDEDA